MKKLFASLAIFAFCTSTYASVLATNPGPTDIKGVKIAKDGTVTTQPNQAVAVSLIGAGLRTKKVAIVNVNVYVAELLSNDSTKFVHNEKEALSSLDQNQTVALRLNFLRTVDAATVQQSFSEGLKANKVDQSNPAISQFLDAVKNGGDATTGKALVIVLQKNTDHSESCYYEDTNGQVTHISGPEGYTKAIMSIWLGNTAQDSGLTTLKASLIGGN